MSETFLAVDLGTTHTRASLIDSSGAVLGFASRDIPVLTGPAGAAEQDPDAVWNDIRALLRQVVAESGGRNARALSLSVQGDAIILVDEAFAPVHNAILGMDYRAAEVAGETADRLGSYRIFRRTGMRPHPMNSLCKVLWFRKAFPGTFHRTRRIFTYCDFILSRMGAEPVIDQTMASRTMGFDQAGGDWSDWMLGKLAVDRQMLSRVAAPGAAVGRMSRTLTGEIGLSAPPLLVAGAHDQVCAALGAGLPNQADGVISSGSAEVLSAAFPRPVLTRAMHDGFYPCYRFAVPGMFFSFSLNHAAGTLLDWFRRLAAGGSDASFDALFTGLPAGPSSILVLPHFNGSGTPSCDVHARGAILGLTLSTTPRDIARGILESLAYELRVNLDRMRRAGVAFSNVAAVGGGARCREWLQIKADILELPIRAPYASEAASLGAAILAGTGTGSFSTPAEGITAMVKQGPLVEPRARLRAAYAERYSLYKELSPHLMPIMRRLEAP